MKKTVIVNIYNFIRMSHVEPSVFIPDDFETVQNQITLIRQYGFPATYALKYDALMEPRYQELLKVCTDVRDEISAWWEITEPLCRKAGVTFRGAWTEEFDERVNSAYCIGYTPEERRKLVDAYMDDFLQVFGFYPKTIGSWVLDTVTVAHAAEKYGIVASAICRDQMGTDGFTLWGGYPNGIYYPSLRNENIPANTYNGQLSVPMFRLLGPDPIYNFEQDVRPGLHGVYTLEPSWLIGRNEKWIDWFFGCLTEEDTLGVGYAHVGQENNFLWENIKPGMEPQLKALKALREKEKVRIETMADSGEWFRNTYRLTPPMTFQASGDWDTEKNLSAQWYACSNYRLGFLGEEGHLRIRDFFLYRENYPSRYLEKPMTSTKSTFDALPLLFPQIWIDQFGQRPYIRLLDENGREPQGKISWQAPDELTARAVLSEEGSGAQLACFTMYPDHVLLEGDYRLCFDTLPVFRSHEGEKVQEETLTAETTPSKANENSVGLISMEYEGFSYGLDAERGLILRAGTDGVVICPEEGKICLRLGVPADRQTIFSEEITADSTGKGLDGDSSSPFLHRNENGSTAERNSAAPEASPCTPRTTARIFQVPPMAPVMEPKSCLFPAGSAPLIRLHAPEPGEIRYTLDGTAPTKNSPCYSQPLKLNGDTVIHAGLFLPDGRCSEIVSSEYRFTVPGLSLTSGTRFDPRPVFHGNGIADFLEPLRGSLDYLDGRWRGTLENLEICGQLPELMPVEQITVGFLSHHRSGIIYPEYLELYTGPDAQHLAFTAKLEIPCRPCPREIARQDFSLPVRNHIGAFRFVAHRYAKMPQWCCYRGSTGVFTMADNVYCTPMYTRERK